MEQVRIYIFEAKDAAIELLVAVYGVNDEKQLIIGKQGKLALTDEMKASLASGEIVPRIPEAARARLFEFNFSHTPHATVIGCARTAIGVDAQELMDEDPIVVKHYFPAQLAERLAASTGDRRAAYTECWTRLEAAIKADGRGFDVERKELSQIYDSWHIESRMLTDLPEIEGLSLSIALKDEFELNLHTICASDVRNPLNEL